MWIKLPCDIGDTVYYIDQYDLSVKFTTVQYFTITRKGVTTHLEGFNIKFWDGNAWGQTVFLRKKDAEKALDRLKDEVVRKETHEGTRGGESDA